MNFEVIEALGQISREKGVDKRLVIDTLAAGLNAIGAVEEAGIETESHAMAALHEFDDLVPAGELGKSPTKP